MEYRHFTHIPAEPPEQRIYARLGFASGKTCLQSDRREQITASIRRAADFIGLQGAVCRCRIVRHEADRTVLEEDIVLQSAALARLLQPCRDAVLLAVTAGDRIVREIAALQSTDLATAVVYDATAAEMTDAGLSWLCSRLRTELRSRSAILTERRFSAGYGDFSLEHQTLFARWLRMAEWGVSVNDHYMLVPEKSVTAVAGIVAGKIKK